MSTRKTIKVWLFRCLLILGILAVAALVLVPRLINLEMVRSNITDKLSRDLGGEITYRQLQLSYIPSPHVVIHKAEILVPDSYQIKIHRLKIYPQLVPLLKGRLQVAFIRLEYADYFMKLPQISNTEQKADEITSIDDIIKSITATLRTLPKFKLPDLKLKLKYGKVNLVDPFGRMFKLRQLQGDYHRSPNKLDFSIRCQSNLWDQVVVTGSLNPMNFE
ncbi:MAG: AsmA family protein, partial [Desulfobacterales bacterium]|nr:AsmA family protein [Desulfobacterales bacterium]